MRMHDARLGARHAHDIIRGRLAREHGFIDVGDGEHVRHPELPEQLSASRRRGGEAQERGGGFGSRHQSR